MKEVKGYLSFAYLDLELRAFILRIWLKFLKNHRFSISLLVLKLLDLRLVFIFVAGITALNCALAVQKYLLHTF